MIPSLKTFQFCKFCLSFLILLSLKPALPQNINTAKFQYISPTPSSKFNSTKTNIILRYGKKYDVSKIDFDSIFNVYGNMSGKHAGKIILAENKNVLIFKPYNEFLDDEVVTVKVSGILKTISGKNIPELEFNFATSEIKKEKNKAFDFSDSYLNLNKNSYLNKSKLTKAIKKNYTIQKDILPTDFPIFTIDSINNPSPGSIFFAPFITPTNEATYLIISDNYGVPIFYRKMSNRTFDFKLQPVGLLSYFEAKKDVYFLLDSSYTIVDTLKMGNGYPTNMHELTMLENHHAFLMCYDEQTVDMSQIIPGGKTNATVVGLVIQELDENKNVIFQWRSWDHLEITDATEDKDLTGSVVDYIHGNAIEIDYDENILVSCRNLDEILKINRITGDIIWTLGGEKSKNNQFDFINDSITFSHQHDIRRLPNGNITIFDNGNLHRPNFSRVVEYELDEINKTTKLIWEYRNNPQTYSGAMGSAQRLSNQNTLIGWGWTAIPPSISEVKLDGTVALYLTLTSDSLRNYRAFKFPWKTNIFVSNPDSLIFGYIPLGDSSVKSLSIINNFEEEIEINGLLNRDSSFVTNISMPIIIPPLDTSTIEVTFKPKAAGGHLDDLYLQWNKTGERIAQVIPMTGTTDSMSTDITDGTNVSDYSLSQNYPNPFNPSTTINFTLQSAGKVILKIYDVLGRKIKTLISKTMESGKHHINFNAATGGLPSGVYIYSLRINDYFKARKMILLR